MTDRTETELYYDLQQFTGTEQYYSVGEDILLTDGTYYFFSKISDIDRTLILLLMAHYIPQISNDEDLAQMHFWHFEYKEQGLKLTCYLDNDVPPVLTKVLELKSFQISDVLLYGFIEEDKLLLILPGEY